VADSDPDAEVEEAMTKARGVAALAGLRVRERSGGTRPRGPVRHVRPDPARGIIESILVREGEPVALAAHLARLRASAAALGLPLPPDLAERIHAATVFDGALRVTATTDGVTVAIRPLPEPGPVQLTPVVLPGGLGAHKWADRRLIDAPGAPLFLDLDGSVLEAGHAAVALPVGRTLLVPPLDGRILPSVSRAQLIADAIRAGYTIRCTSFGLPDGPLILTSALRGTHIGTLTEDRALVL
jgi:para-aminobenzoate synthetase/4-amino-4-deoxychorismate lyase